jgi:hypothetical protein
MRQFFLENKISCSLSIVYTSSFRPFLFYKIHKVPLLKISLTSPPPLSAVLQVVGVPVRGRLRGRLQQPVLRGPHLLRDGNMPHPSHRWAHSGTNNPGVGIPTAKSVNLSVFKVLYFCEFNLQNITSVMLHKTDS